MPLKAMSQEELQQSEEPAQYPATSRLFTHMSKALSIAAVCGVILVIACVFRVDKVPRSQASESMEKWDQKDASGQCGLMEKNMDYVAYSGWGKIWTTSQTLTCAVRSARQSPNANPLRGSRMQVWTDVPVNAG